MKKTAFALATGLWVSVILAAPALAQSELPPPEVGGIGVSPGSEVVTPPGGTAFTGSSVTLWMVLTAALLVAGIIFVLAGRRRASAAAL